MSSVLDAVLASIMPRLTRDPLERRNVLWGTLAAVLAGAAGALFGGELWSGFLTMAGFSTAQIGIVTSAGTFGGAFGLLAFMGLADRVQARIRVYVLCVAATALAPLLTVLLALASRSLFSLSTYVAVLAVVSLGQALLSALWIMLDYPVLVRTITPGLRGRMFAILTVAYGVLAIVLGVLSARVLKGMAYPTGYVWCFLAAAAIILTRALVFGRQRELPALSVPGVSRSVLPFAAIVDVVRLREFRILAGPHVLRGLALGVAGFAVPMGLRHLHLPQEYPGYATSANQAAGILGGIVLGLIADRWGAGKSTLLGDILLALGLGTIMLFRAPILFLALYLLLHLGRNIEDSAVPFGTTIIVPAEHMGAFSAARLMILQGSSAVGSLLFGYLFLHYSPMLLFGIGAVMKLANGIWFRAVFEGSRPAPKPSPAEEPVAPADLA